jgi:DNA-binding winged helix-turn-helix (wHTH) protein
MFLSRCVRRHSMFSYYLAAHSGRVVNKDELFAVIWPDVVVTDDSLVQCVREIRRALHDDEQQIVRTVQRRGYVLTRLVMELGNL